MAKKKEKNNEVAAVEQDIKKYSLLESVQRSEGGKMLILGFQKEAMSAIDKVRSLYKSAPEVELRTWCAVLDSRLTLLFAFQRAPKNKADALVVLEELLKAPDTEEL